MRRRRRTPNAPTTTPVANTAANTNAPGAAPTYAPGSAQDIALHQPDYRATVAVQTGPAKFDLKIAKVGEAWRIEQKLPAVGNTITFLRPGQPTLQILADKKQYIEYTDGGDVNPITRTLQGLSTPGVTFEKVGSEAVGPYQTTKYRGTKEGENGQIVLYSAHDLRDLIVKVEAQKENVTFSATWSDISLDVKPDEVQPPADLTTVYKKIDAKDFTSQFSSAEGGDATASAPPAAHP